MKLNTLFKIFFSVSLLAFAACSDNEYLDVNNPGQTNETLADYFPSEPGTTWIYERTGTTSEGDNYGPYYDTVSVQEHKMIDGKNAIVMRTVAMNDEGQWTESFQNYAIEGENLYMYFSPTGEFGGLDEEMSWVQIYGPEDEYELARIEDIEFDMEGFPVEVDILMASKKLPDGIYDYKNKSYKTREMMIDGNVTMTISIPILGDYVTEISMGMTMKYAKGIGMVYQENVTAIDSDMEGKSTETSTTILIDMK